MMMSEFVERTGFTPTFAEYKEIEEEYYEFDGDKDKFCKKWLKDGGIQRLARQRVLTIEALEHDLEKEKSAHEHDSKSDADAYIRLHDKFQGYRKEMEACNDNLRSERDAAIQNMNEFREKYLEEKAKLEKIQEVFRMLVGQPELSA